MIYLLVDKRHSYTVKDWLGTYDASQRGEIRVMPYQHVRDFLTEGVYIFADIERLSGKTLERALWLYDKVTEAGCITLNHPSRSLKRYDLQKALNNDFSVYRQQELQTIQPRFPVFLRNENDHRGNTTPLLHNKAELDAAYAEHPGSLCIEYLNTADDEGIYRKYSALLIADRLIPRHVYFSSDWMIKLVDDAGVTVDDRTTAMEFEYIKDNPHADTIRAIFKYANIDYGRIDYSLYQGRLQTWEINTNPCISPGDVAIRKGVNDASNALVNAATMALHERSLALEPRRFWCGIGLRKRHKPRFIDYSR